MEIMEDLNHGGSNGHRFTLIVDYDMRSHGFTVLHSCQKSTLSALSMIR